MDPLFLDLSRSLDDASFENIYGISKSDAASLVETKEEEDDCDDIDNIKHVARVVNLLRHPMSYIHNKWKVIVFCCHWWANNFCLFVSWCHSYFSDEQYFTKLKDEEVLGLRIMLAYVLYLLRKYIIVILMFEARKVVHHKAYEYITSYIDWIGSEAITIAMLQDKTSTLPRLLTEAFKLTPRRLQSSMVKRMNAFRLAYHVALCKRFKTTTESMRYWAACQNLDPASNAPMPESISDAFGYVRFGPSLYSNDPEKYRIFSKEYWHFRTVMVPLYQSIDVSDGAYEFDATAAEKNMSNELLCAQYKIDGDIIAFFKRSKYTILDIFAVRALDNPPCSVDDERAMSSLAWVARGPLISSLSGDSIVTRLFAIWNKDIL